MPLSMLLLTGPFFILLFAAGLWSLRANRGSPRSFVLSSLPAALPLLTAFLLIALTPDPDPFSKLLSVLPLYAATTLIPFALITGLFLALDVGVRIRPDEADARDVRHYPRARLRQGGRLLSFVRTPVTFTRTVTSRTRTARTVMAVIGIAFTMNAQVLLLNDALGERADLADMGLALGPAAWADNTADRILGEPARAEMPPSGESPHDPDRPAPPAAAPDPGLPPTPGTGVWI